MDKDRKRHERNDEIVRSLEEIEMRMRTLTSKTNDLEKYRFSKYPLQKYQDIQSSEKEWKEKLSPSNHNSFRGYDVKTQIGTLNCELNKNPKQNIYPHGLKMKSDDLNSLAEHMTNSISSRYYKKDVSEYSPFPNHSFNDFEKGFYDERENQKIKKDLVPSSQDVTKSYDMQIEGNDGNFDRLKENEIYSNLLEQRNDIQHEIDIKSLKRDEKTHNQLDDIVRVNEGYTKSIQEPSETGTYENTETNRETSNDWLHTENIKKCDKSDNDSKVISNFHYDKILETNGEKNISGLNTEVARQSIESQRRHEEQETKMGDDLNEREIFDHSSYLAKAIAIDHHEDSQVNQRFYPNDSTQLNKQRNGETSNQIFETQYENPPEEPHDDHEKLSEVKYDEHGKLAMYSEIQHDLHGPQIDLFPESSNYPTNSQKLQYNAHEQQGDQYPDSSNHPANNHELQYNAHGQQSHQYPNSNNYLATSNEMQYNAHGQQIDQYPDSSNYPTNNHELQYEVQGHQNDQFSDSSNYHANKHEVQYDAHGQQNDQYPDSSNYPINNNELQYDAHGQQNNQYPDFSNDPTNSHELPYEENEKNVIQTDKNEESVMSTGSRNKNEVETYQENKKEPGISTETADSRPKTHNDLLRDQLTARDANDPATNEQIQIGDHIPSSDLHLDNQYESQTQQFEVNGQHEYNENDQAIPQYDENGQLLQGYDQNAIYQYDQQYDNTAQNYGAHNEEYHQQYGQYDEGQIYQQTEGIHATGKDAQQYMNQVGQYEEHNPTLQNYQYTEGTNGAEIGIFTDQDERYEDQQPPQIYQSSGAMKEFGENINVALSQDLQYEQIDPMTSEAYQHPQTNVTSVEGSDEQSLPNEA